MDQTDENRGLFPGLNTLRDRLALAVSDGSQYLAEPLDVQKADAFARSAHILAEWVVMDHNTFGYQSQGDCRKDIYQRCPYLKAIRDLSNMAKHGGKLEEGRTPYFRATKRHGGAFSRDFSRDFDISKLVLVMPDETELDFEEMVAQALRFWEEFFTLGPSPKP